MITLDTQVMVFDALEPRRLSRRAKQALTEGSKSRSLACSDICLWELAMLAARGKIDARGDPADRLVAATALEYGVPLVTADAELRKLKDLKAVW